MVGVVGVVGEGACRSAMAVTGCREVGCEEVSGGGDRDVGRTEKGVYHDGVWVRECE